MLDFTFPKGLGWAERGVVTKRGNWNIQKSSFDLFRGDDNKWK